MFNNNLTAPGYHELMKFDFRSVLAFVAVVETGNIYSAAALMGCSQPAISIYLKRMRSYFSEPLFTREGRCLIPTQSALSLCQLLRLCLDNFCEILALLNKSDLGKRVP